MNQPPTTKRRFVRYRLRTLLLLPVLFAAGWWWVTWPERTARRFVGLVAAGDVDGARAMFDEQEPSDGFWLLVKSGLRFGPAEVAAGGWGDYAAGRRRFTIAWESKRSGGDLEGFVASRGSVSLPVGKDVRTFALYGLKQAAATEMAAGLADLYDSDPEDRVVADEPRNSVLVRGSDPVHSQIEAWIEVFEDEAEGRAGSSGAVE